MSKEQMSETRGMILDILKAGGIDHATHRDLWAALLEINDALETA